MTDYTIKMDLLKPAESARLHELGADLGPQSLKLKRRLSRREMLDVWGIIWSLRERINDEENAIHFAVGDWLVAAEEQYGDLRELVTDRGLIRPRVMISYKTKDEKLSAWVHKLHADLRKYGVDARLDDFEVDYGTSFTDYMTTEINRDSDAVLFVITPDSIQAVDEETGAVHFELQLATSRRLRDSRFRIIGIRLEGSGLPSHLRDHRCIDFRDSATYGAQLKDLAMSLWGQRSGPPLRK